MAAATKTELSVRLQETSRAAGLVVSPDGSDGFRGQADVIRAKWFLGANKVRYTMSCRLDEASHTVHFREAVKESSWGLPPPTFTSEKSSQRGTGVSISRKQVSVGGGGTLEFGRLREELEKLTGDTGWKFQCEAVHMP